MNPHVFREYDIRGVADRDLTDEFTYLLGKALGTFHARGGRKRIAVGRDCRLSSPRLHEALCKGLLETGTDIVDVGIVPTPLMYFAVFHLDLDGGVEITGSHNPPAENGFKMMKGKGSLYGADILALRDLIDRNDFVSGAGKIETIAVDGAYQGFLETNITPKHTKLRFAIDGGNGAAGPTAVAAMRTLGFEPVALLCDMDGTFPVHHPDPTDPHSLELLRETVRRESLDFGIAYDGDGDRIGVVDRNGEILWGDKLLTILARDLLKKHPGAAILGEVKCSQTMYDDIAKHGGRPILWKTGHSLIKTKMKEEGALLAGEMSGHVFFADKFFGFDDAVYATCRLLELLTHTDVPLEMLLADLPKTQATPEIRVDCPDAKKFDVVETVKDHFARTHEVITVDGARILFGDGAWGLVRASNTQPVLVLRFEARTHERLAEIRSIVEQAVAAAQ